MKVGRFTPPCPKCFSEATRVVAIWEGESTYRMIRRRRCSDCGHRFYTGQNEERCIDPGMLKFPSSTRSFKSPLYLVQVLKKQS